jgi:hypothetical protein
VNLVPKFEAIKVSKVHKVDQVNSDDEVVWVKLVIEVLKV